MTVFCTLANGSVNSDRFFPILFQKHGTLVDITYEGVKLDIGIRDKIMYMEGRLPKTYTF